jgi:predicted small secreted protein
MRSNLAKFFLFFFLLTSVGGFLTACNTVHGAGEDLEKGSDKVEKAL